jgi:putative ABC transport system permease protein
MDRERPGRRWTPETILTDLRQATRALASHPGFVTTVVLTLGLAIGANTAMFSALEAVLLRPLPFERPDRIVVLGEHSPSIETDFVSPVTFADWLDRASAFDSLAAFRYWQTVNLEDASGDPEPIDLVTGTANLFEVLGIRPLLGRIYKEEQSAIGGSEAVLSYEFWQRRYHGDRGILGRTIRIRGTVTTVVGVMPPVDLGLALGWGDVALFWRAETAELLT